MKTDIIESFSEKETFETGFRLGKECKAGDIILLDGDLGVGNLQTRGCQRRTACRSRTIGYKNIQEIQLHHPAHYKRGRWRMQLLLL